MALSTILNELEAENFGFRTGSLPNQKHVNIKDVGLMLLWYSSSSICQKSTFPYMWRSGEGAGVSSSGLKTSKKGRVYLEDSESHNNTESEMNCKCVSVHSFQEIEGHPVSSSMSCKPRPCPEYYKFTIRDGTSL
ncbi:hypothetical protein AVEN_239848-1 [Araneus ventricosus]|uniref:Uncharacterized protein n=1 Tax=Araneus ventricosus TaxID=182803 RepID=A0A4Y2H4P5_ARAVE|nr:hypothetical protein AVEN_239848-1 [Araneus ventricosus]